MVALILGLKAAVAVAAIFICVMFFDMSAQAAKGVVLRHGFTLAQELCAGILVVALGTAMLQFDHLRQAFLLPRDALPGWLGVIGLTLIGFGYLIHVHARLAATENKARAWGLVAISIAATTTVGVSVALIWLIYYG